MAQQRQVGNGELPEFPVVGPFGGIQSELPPELVQGLGVADSLNIMFRKGGARVRPAFNRDLVPNAPSLVRIADLGGTIAQQDWFLNGSNEDIGWFDGVNHIPSVYVGAPQGWSGIFDFFNSLGNRIQVAIAQSQLYSFVSGGWAAIPGAFSLGVPSFAVVAQKLCFSQGVDPIRLWDGITPSFAPIAGAPGAKYLFEFGNHLVALNTIESGTRAYQRVHWSGANDPTDWTSFNSGQTDLYNDLGPINGGVKLFNYGYIFQQKGIVQMQLTGNGLIPFYIIPLSSRSKGLTIPRTLAVNGESSCYYVGQDNVYMFDGTMSTPVGDMPMQGRARLGARSRIFADLMLAATNDIFGYVSSSINGVPFNAYWLVIPNVAIWVFNIDEANWTRWTLSTKPTCIGDFIQDQNVRIMDLVGTIEQQQWTPATLLNNNPFPSVMIGAVDGTTLIFDFSGWSEEHWALTTGELDYGDARHESTTKKLRLAYRDHGECFINVQFENEDGEVSLNTPTTPDWVQLPGNNSGRAKKIVVPVNLSGMYVTMKISGEANVPLELTGYAPIFSPGGEIKNAL